MKTQTAKVTTQGVEVEVLERAKNIIEKEAMFDSLQSYIRMVIRHAANGVVFIRNEEPIRMLSPEAEERVGQALREYEEGKTYEWTGSIQDTIDEMKRDGAI